MSNGAKREGAAAMDWRDVGQRLMDKQKQFDEEMDALDVDAQCAEFKANFEDLSLDVDFVNALTKAANGDTATIADWLGDRDRPLPWMFRRHLRDYFRGAFSSKRGAPRDDLRDLFLSYVEQFYREWREENDRLGVSDWGHRDEMKDEAIRFTQERYPLSIDPEKVRDLMKRPRSRRK